MQDSLNFTKRKKNKTIGNKITKNYNTRKVKCPSFLDKNNNKYGAKRKKKTKKSRTSFFRFANLNTKAS
jgi:hypothetical protein